MSIDRSLKVGAKLTGKRSVMTRAERITKMIDDKKMEKGKAKALGLPKTLFAKG